MRIAILTHNYPLQSFEKKDAGVFIYDFAQALAKKLGQVFIFCPDYVGPKENYKKTPVTWFPWGGKKTKLGDLKIWNPISFYYYLSFFWNGRREILRFIKDNQIDFCLAMWSFPNGFFAWQAKKILGVPYAVW